MSQRERQASGGAVELAARPAHGHAPPRPALLADPPATRPPLWEDLFRAASPEQQREWMDLARRQGVLYAHQLGVPTNGSPPPAPRSLLTSLLHGQVTGLEPVRTTPVEVVDAALDERQREAVARALQSPDVCLIQGLPGTGKSRLVAEVVTQAARRGERVLLLAPSTAALDRVLAQVACREGLFAVRCLGREETAQALLAEVRSLTYAERVRHFREESRQRARQEAALADHRHRRRQQEELLWPHLLELAERRQALDAASALLQQRRAEVAGQAEREASAVEAGRADSVPALFATALAAALGSRCEAQAAADKEREEQQERLREKLKELKSVRAELAHVQPLAEARRQTRWWSFAYWRSLFQGSVGDEETRLQARKGALEEVARTLESKSHQAARDAKVAQDRYQASRTDLIGKEIARRWAELDDQLAALDQERHTLDEKWQSACRELDPETRPPLAPTRESVEAAQEGWRRGVCQADERRALAHQWADYLEEHAEALVPCVMEHVNLVAATTAALPGDPHLGDGTGPEPRFDLLVMEEAEQVTESEFLNAARRARRWVLVGEPAQELLPPAAPDIAVRPKAQPRPRGHASSASRSGGPLRSGFFQRLWQQLHCEPCRLPPAWVTEQGRLCCRLRPLTAADRNFLESERVADRPDIELRILSRPQSSPILAEVVFPPATAIVEAKAFILRELDELRVWSPGRSLSWIDGPERLTLRLADAPAEKAFPIVLAPGVREMVAQRAAAGAGAAGVSWYTCCVEFDRQAGWDREQAEEWARRHLGLRDLGRTIRLDVPHRMKPGLARFVSDVLFDGAYLCPQQPDGETAPVEFVPVPSLTDRDQRRPRSNEHGRGDVGQALTARVRSLRGGAGLEIDLADPRHREHLPGDLRSCLPDRGLVNYLEAQAVVRALESLPAQFAPRTAADHAHPNGNGAATHETSRPRVAVMALFPAQAELIRVLLKRSPAISGSAAEIVVEVPASLRQREFDTLLVSFTRSHSHRAVSFGDGPHAVGLTLTRVCRRLILFGDPGTLVRRSQWTGPVDHLDESAARRERDWAARLVAYLTGQGPHPRSFHLREGWRA